MLHRPGARLAAALGLLGAEALVFSALFDAQPLARHYPLLVLAGPAIGLFVVFLTTMVVSAKARRKAIVTSAPRPRIVAGAFVLHLACFALLFLAIDALTRAPGHGRLALTCVLFAALIVSAAAAALSASSWQRLLAARGADAAVGAGVALVAWLAGLASEALWAGLADVTLRLVVAALALVDTGALTVDPAVRVVGLDGFTIHMAPVCSGMEGIGLILVLSVAWLVARRRALRFPRALLLVPLALVAVYGANVVRIVALVVVGAHVDPEIALGGFHSKAGWLLFCLVALGLAAFAERASFFARGDRRGAVTYPAAPYLAPLLTLLATAMATGLFSTGFDTLYGVHIAAAAVVLWHYRSALALRFGRLEPAMVMLGLIVFAAWFILHPAPPAAQVEALRNAVGGLSTGERVLWLSLRVAGSVLVVPVVEELAFRGFLLRRLESADFLEVPLTRRRALPVLFSSLAFGLTHQSVVAGTVAGILFALAQSARGRTEDAIVVHVVANAAVAGAVLLAGQWWLWA